MLDIGQAFGAIRLARLLPTECRKKYLRMAIARAEPSVYLPGQKAHPHSDMAVFEKRGVRWHLINPFGSSDAAQDFNAQRRLLSTD